MEFEITLSMEALEEVVDQPTVKPSGSLDPELAQKWFEYGFHVAHLHLYNDQLQAKAAGKSTDIPNELTRILTRRFTDGPQATKFKVTSVAYDVKAAPAKKIKVKSVVIVETTSTAPKKTVFKSEQKLKVTC